MADPPAVDVVIPVHDTRRPLKRAIASAVDARSRVTVVCHGVDVESVQSTVGPLADDAFWLGYSDGAASPAGPKNAGMDATEAPWIVFLDSDDYLAPSAIPRWLDFAKRHCVDAVIAPERAETGPRIRTPPVRLGRRAPLDAVKDRLLYRTAPLGMIRRSLIEASGARFTEGLATGEDLAFSARLWLSSWRVGYARGAPDYIVGEDAVGRITSQERPVAAVLAPVDRMLTDPWLRDQRPDACAAFAVRAVRGTLFSAVLAATVAGSWSEEDETATISTLERLERFAPGYRRVFSRLDHALLERLEARDDATSLAALSVARRRFATPKALLTRDIRDLLCRDAPVRLYLASFAL